MGFMGVSLSYKQSCNALCADVSADLPKIAMRRRGVQYCPCCLAYWANADSPNRGNVVSHNQGFLCDLQVFLQWLYARSHSRPICLHQYVLRQEPIDLTDVHRADVVQGSSRFDVC
jgi:hypothetical protein